MAEVEEEFICSSNDREKQFDDIIGLIEDIIIEPQFVELQQTFMEKHHGMFVECEENKLEYMDIFNSYTQLIEKYIERCLLERLPEFSMKNFLKDLIENRSELDGEVFDILVSFTDFLTFKEMLLDYKAAKEGNTPDLSISNVAHHKGD